MQQHPTSQNKTVPGQATVDGSRATSRSAATLILPLIVPAGAAITEACEQAQHIADILSCHVEFGFNGVKCVAVPGGCAAHLADQQQVEQSRKLARPLDQRIARSAA